MFFNRFCSQLIQLEEAEAAIDEATKLNFPELGDAAGEETEEKEASIEEKPDETPSQAVALSFDEKTAAEIAVTAPEQRRLLTAVRKALEVNPDDSEPFKSIVCTKSYERSLLIILYPNYILLSGNLFAINRTFLLALKTTEISKNGENIFEHSVIS